MAWQLIQAGLRRPPEDRAGTPAEHCCNARPILCSLSFYRKKRRIEVRHDLAREDRIEFVSLFQRPAFPRCQSFGIDVVALFKGPADLFDQHPKILRPAQQFAAHP